jgi:hypothetical protein
MSFWYVGERAFGTETTEAQFFLRLWDSGVIATIPATERKQTAFESG